MKINNSKCIRGGGIKARRTSNASYRHKIKVLKSESTLTLSHNHNSHKWTVPRNDYSSYARSDTTLLIRSHATKNRNVSCSLRKLRI